MISLQRKLCFGPAIRSLNSAVLEAACACQPDLVWLEKAVYITDKTISALRRNLPQAMFVHHSNDDQFNIVNQTRYYLRSIPLYDAHVTTNPLNIAELTRAGARKVLLREFAYCSWLHRPIPLTAEDRQRWGARVGFVGSYEQERADSVFFLAANGVPIRLWGAEWKKDRRLLHPMITVEPRAVWDEDYVKVLNATDINLGFLRKSNRDTATGRSLEIPACARFMLAERTERHLGLFTEGKEAEFFGSNAELVEKVSYYLAHAERREEIGLAGRRRCVESGYSNTERLRTVLDEL